LLKQARDALAHHELAARTSRKFGLKVNSLWHEALIIDYAIKLGCRHVLSTTQFGYIAWYLIIHFIRNKTECIIFEL